MIIRPQALYLVAEDQNLPSPTDTADFGILNAISQHDGVQNGRILTPLLAHPNFFPLFSLNISPYSAA